MDSGTSDDLNGIWGAYTGDVFTVGAMSTVAQIKSSVTLSPPPPMTPSTPKAKPTTTPAKTTAAPPKTTPTGNNSGSSNIGQLGVVAAVLAAGVITWFIVGWVQKRGKGKGSNPPVPPQK